MFIRFEFDDGIGIYQHDNNDALKISGGILEMLGDLTRAPKRYSNYVDGHSCLGVDYHLGKAIYQDTRLVFAWQYNFFLRLANGELSTDEKEIIGDRYPEVKYLSTKRRRKNFIKKLNEIGVSILLIDGRPEIETEQQAVFNMLKMDTIDEINVEDEMLLCAEAEIFY